MVIIPTPHRLIRGYGWGQATPNPIPNPRQIILARMAKLARMYRHPKLTRLPRQTTLTRLTRMTYYYEKLTRRARLARLSDAYTG